MRTPRQPPTHPAADRWLALLAELGSVNGGVRGAARQEPPPYTARWKGTPTFHDHGDARPGDLVGVYVCPGNTHLQKGSPKHPQTWGN